MDGRTGRWGKVNRKIDRKNKEERKKLMEKPEV